MNRAEFETYILDTYPAEKDYPWIKFPTYAVFRHKSRKCFAFVMDIPGTSLGLKDTGIMSVVNLKCSPLLIPSLLSEPGFYPAYHMNKENWITAVLDGTVPHEKLKTLLDMSYEATAPKIKKRKQPSHH